MKKRKRSAGDWLAHVCVGLKPVVLDPQGKTIRSALVSMGFKQVRDVRAGKHFWITLDGGMSRERVRHEVESMAAKVLSSPIIETFSVTVARAVSPRRGRGGS